MTVFDSPDQCFRCSAKCCQYFMLEIDTPTSKSDFENIRWYLCHRDTTVYVEKGNKWYLHVDSPCRNLMEDGRCCIYDNRPKICREHNPCDCEYDQEYAAKFKFGNLEDLDDFITRRFSKETNSKSVKVQV